MGRLPGFDYKRPFYYMVTMKRATGGGSVRQLPFSKIEQGKIEANAITRAFKDVIEHFHETWYCIEPIWCYVIMPDHLHLLIKIRDIGKRVSLAVLVRQLIKALEKSARGAGEWGQRNSPLPNRRGVMGTAEQSLQRHQGGGDVAVLQTAAPQPLFAFEWHDWIVKKKGQLDAFIRYIRENAERAWARRINRQYFSQIRRVDFAGREWFAYGNTALLELPVIEPFKCSRKWVNGGPEWREAVARAERIGPGGAGAGTFMSPCEKACGNAIFNAGGAIIMLNPEGFGERWHPTRNKEALCAKGRMLFLSLYEPSAAKPDNATLYKRCHEMGDLILGAERQRQDSETRDFKI